MSPGIPDFKGCIVRRVPNFVAPFTFRGKIYLRKRQYDNYASGEPKPETIATLTHEHTHIKRFGPGLGAMVKYWADKKIRFQEELAAIAEEMKVLKKNGKKFDIDRRAKDLSSIAYLWCTDYTMAKQKLEVIWDEVGNY